MEPSHSVSALRLEFNTELEQYQHRRRNEYAAVTALMLSWEDDDLDCIEEIKQLSTTLRKHFQYTIRQFMIPTQRSQASLFRAISDFLYNFGSSGNLVLIYYGGHGDPDLSGERDAVWAA